MNTLTDYAQAGFEGRQTGATWSSPNWLAEKAGSECRKVGLYPQEAAMGKGYSVKINRCYIVKFDTKNLEFISITRVTK